jgi:hypothetical protein
MTFETFKTQFLEWVQAKIEPTRGNGYPICPFARKARLQDRIQFINAPRGIFGEFLEFDEENYDIGIAWLGEFTSGIEHELADLKKANPHLLYFLSTPQSGHFAKNFTNCVLIQKKDDIEIKRQVLLDTTYYDDWPEDYYKEIMNNE